MAFDFDILEETSDELMDTAIKGVWREYCDAGSLGLSYLKDKGYFIADKFYMLHPLKYLGVTRTDHTYHYLHGMLFITLGPDESLKTIPEDFFKNLKIAHYNVKSSGELELVETQDLDINCIDHMPIAIFQHHEGPADTPVGEIPEELFGCKNDFVVFRGVFKAIKSKNSTDYRLEKIWDRYYFGYPVINTNKKK